MLQPARYGDRAGIEGNTMSASRRKGTGRSNILRLMGKGERNGPRFRPCFEHLEPRLLLASWPTGNEGWFDFQTWDQGDPVFWQGDFNQFTPTGEANDTSTRSVVGCVATAEAQLAWYWQYPESILFANRDSYTSLSMNLNPLDIDIINIDGGSSSWGFPDFPTLNTELATIDYLDNMENKSLLSLAVGIKSEMNYSEHGSGAWVNSETFKKLGFGSADMASDGWFVSEAWNESVKQHVVQNLKSGAPVVLAVYGDKALGNGQTKRVGHAVVLEGYRDDSGDEFLVNMGSGGAWDDWYSLPQFTTGSITWDDVETVVYNVFPAQGWNQDLGDAQNSSRSPYAAPTAATEKWHVNADDVGDENLLWVPGIVVGAGGAVYLPNNPASGSASLFVVNDFGDKVGEVELPSISNDEEIEYPAQAPNGMLFLPTDTGKVYRVDPSRQTANLIFDHPEYGQLRSVKIDEDGQLFVATFANGVYQLDQLGTVQRHYQPAGVNSIILRDQIAIDDVRDRVYVPYYDSDAGTSHLGMFDRANGTLLDVWDFGAVFSGLSAGAPVVGPDGTVYVGNYATLWALEPSSTSRTLSEKWHNTYGGSLMVNTPPAIGRDGTLYVTYRWAASPDDEILAAVNPQTGVARWEQAFSLGDNGDITQILAAANQMVVFAINRSNVPDPDTLEIYAYSDLGGSSRQQVWRKDFGASAGNMALGPGNTLYVLPRSGGGRKITALSSGEQGDPRGVGMGFEDNNPPVKASDPGIAVGEILETTTAHLSWAGSDPDGHDVKYTVLLGVVDDETTLMLPIATGVTGTSYDIEGLTAGTAYTWKVVATDGQSETEGPTWTFATAPSNAAIDPKIVFQPTVFDDQGTGEVSALPSDEEWIDEWTPHWVEIWVSDQDGSNGIGSASLDLGYMGSVFTATTIEFGPAFTEGQQQSIDDQNGVVSLSASTTRTDVGDDRPALFARVHLTAEEHDQGLDRDESTKYTEYVQSASIGVGASNIEVVFSDSTAGDVEPVGLPSTALWPVMYDIDDNGEIGAGDIGFFITALERAFSNPESPLLWADFDHSGSVGAGDIGLLVPNLFKFSHQDRVSYDPDFPKPEIWGQLLMVEPSQAARFDAAWLTSDELASTAIAAMERLDNGRKNGISLSPDSIQFEIADLPGEQLGQTVGERILIDTDAAGYGWFVDATPYDDIEFSRTGVRSELVAAPQSPAVGTVDLLTVVMHELGHVTGLNHTTNSSFMDAVLPLGTRRSQRGEADDSLVESRRPPPADIAKPAGRLRAFHDILDEIPRDADKDATADWAHDEYFALLAD